MSNVPPELKVDAERHVRELGGLSFVTYYRQDKFLVALARLRNGRTAIGVTMCSKEDEFNTEVGKLIALSRLSPVREAEDPLLYSVPLFASLRGI